MERPIIIEGEPFDWEEGGKNMLNVVDAAGEVNWQAAFSADPGVMQCPRCREYLWKEGTKVQCPNCDNIFFTKAGG